MIALPAVALVWISWLISVVFGVVSPPAIISLSVEIDVNSAEGLCPFTLNISAILYSLPACSNR